MFREISINLQKNISKEDRKKQGIFFTPLSIRQKILGGIEFKNKKILEPSFGSGEFIFDILEKEKDLEIDGIELHSQCFENFQNKIKKVSNNVQLYNIDFLNFNTNKKYNLIIGNPPYFSIKKDKQYWQEKFPQLSGKFDIYILFLLYSMSLLEHNGELRFVIPAGFLNTNSFQKVREYIFDEFSIENIIFFDSNEWEFTKQNTIGIIIKNFKKDNKLFSLKLDHNFFFNSKENIKTLSKYLGYPSLKSLGFEVKTGEIIWNENKEFLSDSEKYPILIHGSFLGKGTLSIPQKYSKPLFIREKEKFIVSKPTILLYRGNGNNGTLKYALYLFKPQQQKIIVENHIYKITHSNETLLEKLYNFLLNTDFIQLCIYNGCITKSFIYDILVNFQK